MHSYIRIGVCLTAEFAHDVQDSKTGFLSIHNEAEQ